MIDSHGGGIAPAGRAGWLPFSTVTTLQCAAFGALLDCAPVFHKQLDYSTLLPLHENPQLTGLVALRSITNAALQGTELPKRLKLLNWGDNETTKGNVKVGPETVKALAANQAKFGFDKIALDFNHNSLPGHPNFKADPREVAAYGVPVVVDGDGVYLDKITYTPSGEKFAREYIDLSPTPRLNKDGEVDFLHSVALCPQGAVKDLSFFNADFLTQKANDMNFKQLLCTLLGLSADAGDSEIETAAKAFADKAGKQGAGDPTVTAMAAEIAGLTKSVTALATEIGEQKRQALVDGALRDGKLVPLNIAKTLSLEQLTALIAELPPGQVPLEQRTPENVQALSVVRPTTAEDEVRKQLGISKDAWDKHNKAAA